MSREQEFAAKTVEAAIAEAEQALGKSRDDLEIQVLSQGSGVSLGLVASPREFSPAIHWPRPGRNRHRLRRPSSRTWAKSWTKLK